MTLTHATIWDQRAALAYDTPGTGMFAPEVLQPAIDRLAALAGPGPILEFAIGTGRIALPLLDRGLAVHGLDIAPAMVEVLRTKAPAARLPVTLGDMASAFVPGGPFTLVALVFNGLSNLLTQDEQIACFANAARHLAPGGRFVVEMWLPRLPHPQDPQALAFRAEPDALGFDTFDVLAQRVTSHHLTIAADGTSTLFRSPHRWVWPAEMDLMARLAGLALESRHADFAGTTLTPASPNSVSVYRKG